MLERKTSISERRPSVSSERRASSAGSGYESSESLSGRGFNSLNNEEPPIVFVIEPSKSLFCAIHSGLLHTPVILATCGHTFCRSCITKHLEKESSCPVDKVSVPTNVNLVPNLAVEGQIADLLVHCRFGLRRKHKKWMVDKKGCPEQLRLSQREEHETTCTFASYPCPYCDCSPMKKFELEEHMKTCKKIPCPHKKYGCSFEGIKEEIEVHKSSCMFESIKDYIVTTDNRIIELERQIQTIQTENQTLLQSLSQLKLNCEESKAEMNTRQSSLTSVVFYYYFILFFLIKLIVIMFIRST